MSKDNGKDSGKDDANDDWGGLNHEDAYDLGLSSRVKRKYNRSETLARRDKVWALHRAGRRPVDIQKLLVEMYPNLDEAMVSNDLAYKSKEVLDGFVKADGVAMSAGILDDYLAIRQGLMEIVLLNIDAKNRIAASRTMLQLNNDVVVFMTNMGLKQATDGGGNEAANVVNELRTRLDGNASSEDIVKMFEGLGRASAKPSTAIKREMSKNDDDD